MAAILDNMTYRSYDLSISGAKVVWLSERCLLYLKCPELTNFIHRAIYVDFMLYEAVVALHYFAKEVVEQFPKLLAFRKRIEPFRIYRQ